MEERYYEWGNQDNPTLVFLHGMGAAGLSFGELAQFLLNNFHVVSFNLPGHMAERLKRMIHSLGQPEVFLVGHSWGAHLALYVAGLYPETIKGLVLLDGGYFQKNPTGDSLEQEIKNIEAFNEAVRFPSWEAFLESEKADSPRWSEEIEAGSLAQVTEIDGEIRLAASPLTAKAVIKGINLEPTTDIFSKVQSPMLLLHSTLPEELEDERRKAIEKFAKGIPQAQVQVIPNTSHDIYRDAPEKVAGKIKEWIYQRPNE